MRTFFDWLNRRFEYRRLLDQHRRRVLPEGPSWWLTSASCLFWLMVVECVTGLLLMSTYSPSMASAWASVHFIDQTAAGKFLRGVHHYASHVLIALFAVHVIRVLLTRAYRAPREFVWITGLLLFPLVIAWTVTGNPLSATQKGVAQTQVEGNILGSTPMVGAYLRTLLLGGDDVGNLTLTRLYFLHVGLLPLLVGALCAVHLHQVLKHSPYRAPQPEGELSISGAVPYWPYQTFRNALVLAMVVGGISVLAAWQGAPLYAPADPELPHSPRPEWYFRWLFELRRHFTGDMEFIATLVIPSTFLAAFMAVPFLDRFLSGKKGVFCRLAVVLVCATGWGWLTYASYRQDWNDAEHLAATAEFEALSARARLLADTVPISEAGAVELLRNDPQTQGPKLFAQHCASCHSNLGRDKQGITANEVSAPNLHGFGTAEWIAGFLDGSTVSDDDHFGKTAFSGGDMTSHVQGLAESAGEAGTAELRAGLQAVAIALAAEARRVPYDSPEAAHGRTLLTGEYGCTDCHKFHEHGELGMAADLTGYASPEWLAGMIANPAGERYYADRNDRMPSFVAEPAELSLLSPKELELLVQWMVPQTALYPPPGAAANSGTLGRASATEQAGEQTVAATEQP